jgi:hypothetical protein
LTKKRLIWLITSVIIVIAALPGLKIIAETLNKEKAYQFMVNGQKWFTVSQKDSLESMLDEYKKQY